MHNTWVFLDKGCRHNIFDLPISTPVERERTFFLKHVVYLSFFKFSVTQNREKTINIRRIYDDSW